MQTRRNPTISLLAALLTLTSLINANAIADPTAAPEPHAAPQPTPHPTQQPLPNPTILTPDDVLLDARGYGSTNYGGGNCQGCNNNGNGAQQSQWAPAAPTTWAPQAVTVIRTQTYCPRCAEQQTTEYKTTTYCPPTTTWRASSTWRPASSWHATSKWHTSYVAAPAPVPVETKTVQPQYVTVTAAAQSQVQGAICSTLYAHGPGLPTTRQGACGTILVVNEAGGRGVLWSGVVMGMLSSAIVGVLLV